MTSALSKRAWPALVLPFLAVGSTALAQGRGAKNRERKNLVELPEGYVRSARLPEGGCQPRLQVHPEQGLVVLFFRGEGERGDLYLTRSPDEALTFSAPVRVNSTEGTVLAPGGMHMSGLALDAQGRANVVWIGEEGLRFALETEAGAFAEIDLARPAGLGSSAAVVVDPTGLIHLFYAADGLPSDAAPEPDEPDEPEEGDSTDANATGSPATVARIYTRVSSDGREFSTPEAIDTGPGASPGSDITARYDTVAETLYVLFRSFQQRSETSASRDQRMIQSKDGSHYRTVRVEALKLSKEPRSLSSLAQDTSTTLVAWESHAEVLLSHVRRSVGKVALALQPRPEENPVVRWAPSVASNGAIEYFLCWMQRPRGDDPSAPQVGWQVWDKTTRGALGYGTLPPGPGNTTPACFARADGGFVVVY